MESAPVQESPMSSHPQGAAPYGRSCTNCIRIKSKCMYRADGTGCERCHRLRKDCHPSVSVRKRNIKRSSNSRNSQLAGNLDDVDSMIQMQSLVKQPRQEAVPSTTQDVSPVGDSVTVPLLTPRPASALSPNTAVSSSSMTSNLSDLSDGLAEEQLHTFRLYFLPSFPFVHIPVTMSAIDLRNQKPFLWLVIMSLTTKSVAQQLALGDEIGQIVSQKVVAKHEKDIDILLGIICYLAWFHYHKKEQSHIVTWSQIAVALVFELGINSPLPGDERQFTTNSWFPPRTQTPQSRSIEERRALLGIYIITSIVWNSLRQMEPLRWTPYMDDCVRILTEGKETDSDILLAFQAKCHIIMDQTTRHNVERAMIPDASSNPSTSFVTAMQLQLQGLWRGLPTDIQSRRPSLLCMYGTEIIIKEALIPRPKSRDTGSLDVQRLEALDSTLTAIERWFQVFFEVPLLESVGKPFSIAIYFSRCLILVYKLMTLNEQGWDTNEVKKRVNLPDILERAAERLASIPAVLGLDTTNTEQGIFSKSPMLLRGMRTKLLAEMTSVQLDRNDQANSIDITAEALSEAINPYEASMCFDDDPLLAEMWYLHEDLNF